MLLRIPDVANYSSHAPPFLSPREGRARSAAKKLRMKSADRLLEILAAHDQGYVYLERAKTDHAHDYFGIPKW